MRYYEVIILEDASYHHDVPKGKLQEIKQAKTIARHQKEARHLQAKAAVRQNEAASAKHSHFRHIQDRIWNLGGQNSESFESAFANILIPTNLKCVTSGKKMPNLCPKVPFPQPQVPRSCRAGAERWHFKI
eukprot:scaffold3321_cov149-Skeletonema_marinoi.AAC.4